MSKLRRNNICSSPRNRNKANNDEMNEISKNGKLKFSKSKLMTHGEFLNRIQKSLYYGGRRSKMSIPLSDYIADTFSETHNGYSLNRLNYSTVGHLRATPCSLLLALVYLDRLKDADPAYTKHVTPTELFLVSMMVATKFYSGHDEEAPYVNWAESINTTSDNLLAMELSFLSAIDWNVFVSNEEFFDKVESLEIILARRQGLNRGFFTYLELNSVMPSVQIAKQFIQSTLVLGLSYTVLVTTMVASVFLASQIPGTYLNASSRSTSTQTSLEISPEKSALSSQSADMLGISTELINSDSTFNGSDMSIILNLDIDRLTETSEPLTQRIEPNTTSWIPLLLSSWYSLLKSDSFEWPVIAERNKEHTCDDGMSANLFCNSSARNEFLSPHSDMERFEFSIQGIKMKWV